MKKKQHHNRRKDSKKNAKTRAKRVGKKVKSGFRAKKPKGPSQKILKVATKIRKECSKLSVGEREKLLKSALERIYHRK